MIQKKFEQGVCKGGGGGGGGGWGGTNWRKFPINSFWLLRASLCCTGGVGDLNFSSAHPSICLQTCNNFQLSFFKILHHKETAGLGRKKVGQIIYRQKCFGICYSRNCNTQIAKLHRKKSTFRKYSEDTVYPLSQQARFRVSRFFFGIFLIFFNWLPHANINKILFGTSQRSQKGGQVGVFEFLCSGQILVCRTLWWVGLCVPDHHHGAVVGQGLSVGGFDI